jgi:uncharacterized protein (DUF433 family)
MAELLGFTAEHVSRLTGLSKGRLNYWDKTGFFSPAHTNLGRTYSRVYTFRDVVGLRAIWVLRVAHHLPLQELRRVGQWLHERYDEPWSRLRLGVAGKVVIFFDPNSGKPIEAKGQGQQVHDVVSLEEIAKEMGRAAESLRDRSDRIGRVEKRRQVASSSWVIAGTRVRTEAIWHFHEAGYDTRGILKEYPQLHPEDVSAAIKFEKDRRQAA